MTPPHVRRALALLADQEYIYGYKAPLGRVDSIMPKEKGLQETMSWPRAGQADPSSTELLLRLLDQRIATLSQRTSAAVSSGSARRRQGRGNPRLVRCLEHSSPA